MKEIMKEIRVLTGITSSGTPHIGNYMGAIKPALLTQEHQSHHNNGQAMYFIADLHSLVKLWDPALRRQYVLEIAATWLALGLNPKKTYFYRQSDIPEISELAWILTTVASKGLLNRAHAYKALVLENLNIENKNSNLNPNQDPDHGITMGLFNYPVLMAADILAFQAHKIPVGKDQIQHIEIARDIGARFNYLYGETFVLPEAAIDENLALLPGLDGRKMSKSYQNTIPIFEEPKNIQKLINKIITNSQLPSEPKKTEDCVLFQLYQAFGSPEEINLLKNKYETGIGWGEIKKILAEKISSTFELARERYLFLISHPHEVEQALQEGAARARPLAIQTLELVKSACGLKY